MAKTEFILTDADIGRVLPITDGFLTDLKRTASSPGYEMPQWSEGLQRWLAGRFVLRGSLDCRDLVSIDTGSGGGWASHWGSAADVLNNASLGFRGGLIVVCVPRGSVWEISISDVPVVKKSAPLGSFPLSITVPRQPPPAPALVGR